MPSVLLARLPFAFWSLVAAWPLRSCMSSACCCYTRHSGGLHVIFSTNKITTCVSCLYQVLEDCSLYTCDEVQRDRMRRTQPSMLDVSMAASKGNLPACMSASQVCHPRLSVFCRHFHHYSCPRQACVSHKNPSAVCVSLVRLVCMCGSTRVCSSVRFCAYVVLCVCRPRPMAAPNPSLPYTMAETLHHLRCVPYTSLIN